MPSVFPVAIAVHGIELAHANQKVSDHKYWIKRTIRTVGLNTLSFEQFSIFEPLCVCVAFISECPFLRCRFAIISITIYCYYVPSYFLAFIQTLTHKQSKSEEKDTKTVKAFFPPRSPHYGCCLFIISSINSIYKYGKNKHKQKLNTTDKHSRSVSLPCARTHTYTDTQSARARSQMLERKYSIRTKCAQHYTYRWIGYCIILKAHT